jgi:hypothetical protein
MGNRVEMGYHSALYVNSGTYAAPSWKELDLARDVTAMDSVDKVDVTTRRTARVGYTANEYGLRSLGWKFDVLVPAAGESNDAYDALETARKARATVDILHVEGGVITTDGLNATRSVCGVFGGEKAEPLKDASARSYELAFMLNSDQDVPVTGTTSGGEFVEAS